MPITQYAPYEEYTDSGIEWLGSIPKGWETRRLKYVVQIRKRVAGREGPDVLSITQQGIKIKDIESGEGQLAADYSNYQHVYQGEFAMNHMDLLTGYVDISNYDGVVSPDYRVFANTNHEVSDDYLLLLFQIGYKQRIFFRYGQGVSLLGRWRFPAENFNNFLIPIPSLEEQQRIVSFLRSKTDKIDQAISIKEQQIALLKERMQIMIQEAVTKGLNPNVPMKGSGIDWIGEIPAHWERRKIRHLFHIGRGRVIPKEELVEDGLYPVYSSQTKNDGIFGYLDTFDFDGDQLTWTTDGANAGTVFRRHGKHNCTNVCGTLKPKSNFTNLDFCVYAAGHAAQFYKRPDTNGAKIMNEEMAAIEFPLPKMEEQNLIADAINVEQKKIEAATSIKLDQIIALKEYKTSLINEAVTGKIKVV